MATINFTSSENNANTVLWSYSTKIVLHTDRPTSTHDMHAEVLAYNNLGVGVTAGSPFTILA